MAPLDTEFTLFFIYSRRTFSKESFQWTKCVVKYLHDLYSRYSFNMLSFLVEVLEKGPIATQVYAYVLGTFCMANSLFEKYIRGNYNPLIELTSPPLHASST